MLDFTILILTFVDLIFAFFTDNVCFILLFFCHFYFFLYLSNNDILKNTFLRVFIFIHIFAFVFSPVLHDIIKVYVMLNQIIFFPVSFYYRKKYENNFLSHIPVIEKSFLKSFFKILPFIFPLIFCLNAFYLLKT